MNVSENWSNYFYIFSLGALCVLYKLCLYKGLYVINLSLCNLSLCITVNLRSGRLIKQCLYHYIKLENVKMYHAVRQGVKPKSQEYVNLTTRLHVFSFLGKTFLLLQKVFLDLDLYTLLKRMG